MTNKQQFGKALAAARNGRNITQQTLADLTGVTIVMIQRYEAGTAFPDLDKTLPALCEALGVSLTLKLAQYHASKPPTD